MSQYLLKCSKHTNSSHKLLSMWMVYQQLATILPVITRTFKLSVKFNLSPSMKLLLCLHLMELTFQIIWVWFNKLTLLLLNAILIQQQLFLHLKFNAISLRMLLVDLSFLISYLFLDKYQIQHLLLQLNFHALSQVFFHTNIWTYLEEII